MKIERILCILVNNNEKCGSGTLGEDLDIMARRQTIASNRIQSPLLSYLPLFTPDPTVIAFSF